jgi:hypothetical protein
MANKNTLIEYDALYIFAVLKMKNREHSFPQIAWGNCVYFITMIIKGTMNLSSKIIYLFRTAS